MCLFPINGRDVPGMRTGSSVIGITRLLLLLAICGTASAQPLVWTPHGPSPNTNGQVENIADREVSGAINAVTPHPTDANVLFVGAVNGGVWRTGSAMSASPSWQHLTDAHGSLSIGALEFDPLDPTNQTLIAGMGRFSSFARRGGARSGILRTTDGGSTWIAIDGGGTIRGLNISGVAPRGSTIVISTNDADSFANHGVWRTTDTGATWTQVSGGGSGLPAGASYDLVGDPGNPARLFTNGGGSGLYRSDNTGATWSKVSSVAMDTMISGAGNIEMAVGNSNNVFVAIVRAGSLAAVFRSANGGNSWTAMDLPSTAGGGIHPGGQGNIHLSIAADPSNANIVYIGGDRQDAPFPNPIGARDYSGRLFRGDASQPPGIQFVHLTHSNSAGPAGGGTVSRSAPHADSRDMDVAANGLLIEGDDGGIYGRTNPQTNNGDWFSMNGGIQPTEFHTVAWDANTDTVIGGAQDTGSPEMITPTTTRWRSVSTADGGVVAVDDASTAGFSTRYSSNQFLGAFRRRVYDSSNNFISQVFPTLTVLGTGAALSPQFYTPIELNNETPTRLIIGAANSVYESLDQGDTVTEIGPGIRVNGLGQDPIAYGAAGNADMLYVGSGSRVYVRTAANPSPLTVSANYTGGSVVGIAIDSNAPLTAHVVDDTRVYRTTNAGGVWTDITGNLASLNPGELRSVCYRTHATDSALVVGGDLGVFHAAAPAFNNWSRLGTGLPNVPVYELEFDVKDNIVLAGTLGRGAWTLVFDTDGEVEEPKRHLPWLGVLLN